MVRFVINCNFLLHACECHVLLARTLAFILSASYFPSRCSPSLASMEMCWWGTWGGRQRRASPSPWKSKGEGSCWDSELCPEAFPLLPRSWHSRRGVTPVPEQKRVCGGRTPVGHQGVTDRWGSQQRKGLLLCTRVLHFICYCWPWIFWKTKIHSLAWRDMIRPKLWE